jgi:adenine-specific DNA-methyltransferase
MTASKVMVRKSSLPEDFPEFFLWMGEVEKFLTKLQQKYPKGEVFDLVITSPPYNIGKEYEKRLTREEYLAWQRAVIEAIIPFVKKDGAVCWQVGSHVERNILTPLDVHFIPILEEQGLKLRNRIVWHFGHGLHETRRLSGRYETLLWYTKGDEYTFNLDEIRIPQLYPGKKAYKGPNKGSLSGNPKGKNPTDVLNIPNVKGNHTEKTNHPCQFPIGLVEFCLDAFTNKGDVVFDPFMGSGSAGAASAIFGRNFIGCEVQDDYVKSAKIRIEQALVGQTSYRPWKTPVYDPDSSPLSKKPESFL